MPRERPICFMFEQQTLRRAWPRARAKTGKRIAARIAMMAITTSSSMRVKPVRLLRDVSMACLLSAYVRHREPRHLPRFAGAQGHLKVAARGRGAVRRHPLLCRLRDK